jgi:mycothiol synthase
MQVSVSELVARATAAAGFRPVSDQFVADLTHGSSRGLVHAEVGGVGYAQASPTGTSDDAWSVETVADPGTGDVGEVLATLLTDVEAAVRAAGGIELTWLVQGPTAVHNHVADTLGYTPQRHLHQMRRPLPTGIPFDIVTRPFRESDIAEWVRVNARAFAWNPEQGSWTADNVRARMDESWFDPGGFLIHERDGRLAGFCWTKIHPDEVGLGEIYVIAVDPDFHGLGLGRALTLAGLQSLSDRSVATGMLFVDADNTGAVALYTKLSFTIHRTDSLFTKPVPR